MKLFCITAAAMLSLGVAVPASAQSEYPVVPGEYVEMSMITIDDGHDLEYANHLAGDWKKGQDYAKAQGWITGYEILANANKRPGEPDLYLVTHYTKVADAAEEERRGNAYMKYMATTDTKLEAASSARATYRHVIGSMLLRKLDWKK